MKIYEKTWESVYNPTDPAKVMHKEWIEVNDMTMHQYTQLARSFCRESSDHFFMMIVKMMWLQRKLTYNGRAIERMGNQGMSADMSISNFYRNDIGFDRMVFTRMRTFERVNSYLYEFFHEFDSHNPFTEPEYYKIPYDVTIDHMCLVYQMPERLEYLEYASKMKYSIADFLDFVINQIYSINEISGKEVYTLQGMSEFPFVKFNSEVRNAFLETIKVKPKKHGNTKT